MGHPVIPSKQCGSCHSWLPLDQFGSDTSKPDLHTGSCRDCRRREHLRNKRTATLRNERNRHRRLYLRWKARALAAEKALKGMAAGATPKAGYLSTTGPAISNLRGH